MVAKKQSWLEYKKRYYLKNVLPLETPLTIQVEPSRACNFKCIYCSHSHEDEKDNQVMLGLNIFEKFINDAKSFSQRLKTITFAGLGEPLLNKHLFEMISLSKEVADSVSLTTNGYLINNDVARKLISSGLDILRVSLQGINAQDYFSTSGVKIDFEKFVNGLDYFYKNKQQCEVVLKMPDIALKSRGRKKLFYDLFEDKADVLTIQNIVPFGNNIDYTKIKTDFSTTIYQSSLSKPKICPSPFYLLLIKADGAVRPCCNWTKILEVGNINNDNIVAIWEGKKLNEFRKLILKDKYPKCRNCPVLKYTTNKYDYIDDIKDKLLKVYS